MKAYKLTDQNGQTYNNTQWGEHITHYTVGIFPDLCSSSWIHFYTDPLIAVLMNPSHAKIKDPILWEAIAEGELKIEALKAGCKKLTTIKQIPLTKIVINQRISFGILCAKQVCKDIKWNLWADNWLNNKNRSKTLADAAAADAAADAAYAAYAAAAAAAYAAADATAAAAADAAYADAAAVYAANTNIIINFPFLAQQTLTYE